MKKKGFTLVELLAVIVILALLILITTTSVSKIVNNSRKDLSTTQYELIKSGAKIWGTENRDKLPNVGECIYISLADLKKSGVMDNSIVNPETNKQIYDDLKIKISNTLSEYGKEIINYEVNPSSIDGCNPAYDLPCSYTKDSNGYEMVTCGTESFYVMSKDNENRTITMLSQYNLDVGYYYKSSSWESYTEIENPTGIQNKDAVGLMPGELSGTQYDYTNVYGGIAFAKTDYWSKGNDGDVFVYGDYKNASGQQQNLIFPHVEKYKEYLIDVLGVDVKNATLMSFEQARTLGCSKRSDVVVENNEEFSGCLNAPAWVYSTSYWLGTATESGQNDTCIHAIFSNGKGVYSTYYSGSSVNGNRTIFYDLGVRPVITIPFFNVE